MRRTNSPTLNSQIIELRIDSLSYNGGRGVGRYEGVVVFIPQTAPGDIVRARVTEKKPRFWEAELVEVVTPSPSRRTAPCPVFDRCGGCAWQHVDYTTQVEQKKAILKSSLRNLEKFGAFEWRAFIAAPSEFGYRNRIQVHIAGEDYGFYAKRTRDLISVRNCLIAESEINTELGRLRPQPGDRRIEIARSPNGGTHITAGERDPEAAIFSQVNEAQNEALKRALLELAPAAADWVMDLYAGSGNLTWPLAERFARIIAVEYSQSAVERARELNPRVEWHAGDTGEVLKRLKVSKGAGLIVLDPPRTGVSRQVVEQIERHAPRTIVYVSCNPTTFARDVEHWLRGGRYRLQSVQGLDMFPQTEHVELIASLCAAT